MSMLQELWQKLEYKNYNQKGKLEMEIENLIEKLKADLKDIKEHKADYCYVEVNDMESIIEYLEQLKEMKG